MMLHELAKIAHVSDPFDDCMGKRRHNGVQWKAGIQLEFDE